MNISNVLEEKKNLEKQIKSIDLEISQLPCKEFYCAKNGNSCKWYESDGKKSKYVPKDQRPYAERLAKKKYLSLRRKDLQQELTAINFYLRHHKETGSKAEKLLNKPAYAELLSNQFKPVNQEFQEWMNAPYESNKSFPEGLIYKTNAGINVRSKSEVMIVMFLHMRKIPFRYECALHLGDNTFYPDFTIKHPQTGKIYYWEHFGQMDNPSYYNGVYPKLLTYTSYGIVPGVNLITTFETKEQPLEISLIENVMDYYLS